MPIDNPLISIITITYNAAKEIGPTIKSLNDQTFRGFEHIVVDGASKDDTLGIVRLLAYNDPIIISEPDDGLYFAMNKGLAKATGKYILFLNAGDSFNDNNSLEAYARATERNPDIIYGDTVIVDSDRHILRPRHLSAPEKLAFQSFNHGMLVCHQAFMVKRDIAPDFNTLYRFSADYDWTIRCIKSSDPEKCTNLNQITINFLENGTTDKNKKASLLERFKIMSLHYGVPTALLRHISFIPRAFLRKLAH